MLLHIKNILKMPTDSDDIERQRQEIWKRNNNGPSTTYHYNFQKKQPLSLNIDPIERMLEQDAFFLRSPQELREQERKFQEELKKLPEKVVLLEKRINELEDRLKRVG